MYSFPYTQSEKPNIIKTNEYRFKKNYVRVALNFAGRAFFVSDSVKQKQAIFLMIDVTHLANNKW